MWFSHEKIVVFPLNIVIFPCKMVIFPFKICDFPMKKLCFSHEKIVVFPLKMVISHSKWWFSHEKIVVFPLKSVAFPLKIVIFRSFLRKALKKIGNKYGKLKKRTCFIEFPELVARSPRPSRKLQLLVRVMGIPYWFV